MFGIRVHSQNLKKDGDRFEARHWFNRRGWFYWGGNDDKRSSTLGWQVVIGRPIHFVAAGIDLEHDEHYISLNWTIWPVSIYLAFETKIAHWLSRTLIGESYRQEDERTVQIQFTREGTIRWKFWTPDSFWSSKTPRYRNGHLNIPDAILGQWDYVKGMRNPVPVTISLPEGSYDGTVAFGVDRWTRRRMRWITKSVSRATIDVTNPPQFAGKGENAWDCDDDAIYSMTCPAASVEDAVTKYADAVLSSRRKHGLPAGMTA